ncbi:MAG: SDR family oxidoreductase [Lewinellaceae bacterium]|nr:SDR family oxidoreductase [Lewinellaceae bacterium]
MDYRDKVVWITGASSGIGEALTYAFAQEGARIVISARRAKELERVRQACPAPDQILVLPLDVTAFESFAGAFQKILNHFGKLDGLVNNAGISQRSKVVDTSLEVDQQVMNVNFMGPVALTKTVLPHFLARGTGQFIVISSVTGKVGIPYRSAYCASKHALQGFHEALRAEVHDAGIRITIVCPGYVATQVSINALKGDGSKHAIMDQNTAEGISATILAQGILQAGRKEKAEVYFGKKELAGIYLMRFAPSIARRIARNIKVR